eukprot:11206293-Lingulodinium_polyedra.AAC.1
MRRPDALIASFFAEIDAKLAAAVRGIWEQWARAGGGCPHQQIAGYVWQFLRGRAEPLRQVLAATPQGAMLLIV